MDPCFRRDDGSEAADMIQVTLADMNAWVAGLLWPLTRILGLVAAAPIFGNTSVPARVKVALGLILAMIMAPTVPTLPAIDPMSWAGLLIVLQELLVGVSMGFVMRIVFAAIEMAGEISSMTMGLGFAATYDPQTRGRSAALTQFLTLIATLAFLAVDAHLILLAALAESFIALPIGASPVSAGGHLEVAKWGGQIFVSGLQLSLPIVAALLITNVALGILTRAAPQLNIFGIGFPVSLGVGLLVVSVALPYLNTPIQNLLNEGIEASRRLVRSSVPAPRPAPVPAPAPAAPPAAP
jgi:flagellar biosynthetic protein FliR